MLNAAYGKSRETARDTLKAGALETVSSFMQAGLLFLGAEKLKEVMRMSEYALWWDEGLYLLQFEVGRASVTFNWTTSRSLSTWKR